MAELDDLIPFTTIEDVRRRFGPMVDPGFSAASLAPTGDREIAVVDRINELIRMGGNLPNSPLHQEFLALGKESGELQKARLSEERRLGAELPDLRSLPTFRGIEGQRPEFTGFSESPLTARLSALEKLPGLFQGVTSLPDILPSGGFDIPTATRFGGGAQNRELTREERMRADPLGFQLEGLGFSGGIRQGRFKPGEGGLPGIPGFEAGIPFSEKVIFDPTLRLEIATERKVSPEVFDIIEKRRQESKGSGLGAFAKFAAPILVGGIVGGPAGAALGGLSSTVATGGSLEGPLTLKEIGIRAGLGAIGGLGGGGLAPGAGIAAKVGAGAQLAGPVIQSVKREKELDRIFEAQRPTGPRPQPASSAQTSAVAGPALGLASSEGRKMGLLDDLGRAGIGAIGGGFSGGVGGALAGGLAGGLLNRGQGLNLGTGIESGLLGLGAGQIGGKLQRGLGTFGQPGIRTQPIVPGQEAAGPGIFGRIGQFGKDVFGGLKGGLGGISQGLGAIRGIFGGGGGPGQPQGAPTGTSGAGTGAPGGFPGGIPRAGGLGGLSGQDLSLLAGLWLFGAGLAQGGTEADLQGIFAGAPEQTRGLIDAQIAAEAARRRAAEEQFLGRRGEARGRLEDILGQGSEQAFGRAIQSRQEQLNRQGLLSGPSGAMDFALAQEAANLRRSQLPALLAFEQETEGGLGSLRGAGLEGALGLQRAGLERQFGLGDQLRSARLIEQLREAESNRSRQNALLRAAGQLGGFGLGLPGQQGGGILEGIFGS